MNLTAGHIWVAAVLLVLAACAGEGPPPQTASTAFDRIQREIFDVHCLSAGCHNSSDQAGNMILAAGHSFDELVNVSPSNQAARDAKLLRVHPGDPDASFIVIKLEGPPSDQGSRMPRDMAPLSSEDIDLIRDWIAAGAPPPAGTPFGTVTPTPTPTP